MLASRSPLAPALALAALALAPACQKKSDSLWIPGATALCSSYAMETYAQSCRYGFARQFNGSIVVSAIGYTLGENAMSWDDLLFVSKDGQEWLEYAIDSNATTQSFNPEPPALFAMGQDLWALLRYPSSTAPEGYEEFLARAQMNADDTWSISKEKTGGWWGMAMNVDGRLRAIEQRVYSGTPGRTWREFNPQTGEVKFGFLPMPDTEPQSGTAGWASWGGKLVSWSLDANQFCRVQVAPSAPYPFTWDCVPRSQLPEGVENFWAIRSSAWGPMLLLKSKTGAWAATVTTSPTADPRSNVREGVLRIAHLGATTNAVMHMTHGAGLLSDIWQVGEVSDGKTAHVERFVRVKGDLTLEEVDVPVSPCAEAAVEAGLCEQVYPYEVARLDDGSLLAVYAVSTIQSPQLGGKAALVALRIVPQTTPCTDCAGPDAGTPLPPQGDPILQEEIEACAHAVSCGYLGSPSFEGFGALSSCVEAIANRDPTPILHPSISAERLLGCGRTAASCRDFALCMNGNHDEAYCAAHPGASCDGTVAVNCGSATAPATDAIDCNVAGNQCWIYGGKAFCGVEHPCTSPQGACSSQTAYWRCLNSTETMATGYACPAGTQCRFSAQINTPVCVAPTPCGASRCEGDVLVGCEAWGEYSWQSRFDCAQQETTCDGLGCVSYTCAAKTDTCAGDVFYACLLGRSAAFDCKAHGFAGCGFSAAGPASCVY